MIVSVASGKGGTGKTLVATSLALSLERKVQLLDCDVEEPDDHVFLRPVISSREGVCVPVPSVDEGRCTHCGLCSEVCAFHAIAALKSSVLVFPELCHGCGACGHLCPEDAISEVEREIGVVETGFSYRVGFGQGRLNVGEAMPTPVIRKLKQHIDRGSTVVIDVSPGTSCPVVESIRGSDFCLLVTEPTPFGLNDLAMAADVAGKLEIPSGVVLNRDGVGDSGVEDYCASKNIPILLRIPLDVRIAQNYSRGITLAEGLPEWRKRFVELYDRIEEMASIRAGG